MPRQEMTTNLCSIPGGPLDIDRLLAAAIAQGGYGEALQDHIELRARGRQQLRRRQANPIHRDTRPDRQPLAEALREAQRECADRVMILNFRDRRNALNNASEHEYLPCFAIWPDVRVLWHRLPLDNQIDRRDSWRGSESDFANHHPGI